MLLLRFDIQQLLTQGLYPISVSRSAAQPSTIYFNILLLFIFVLVQSPQEPGAFPRKLEPMEELQERVSDL
jgi:hypothetical protein